LQSIEDLDLRKAIENLRKKYEMILIEAGPSTSVPAYSKTHTVSKQQVPPESLDHVCDGNPIDTLVLSMFVGKLVDQSCVGAPFLNMTWLQSHYNLQTSAEDGLPCENFNGQCMITIWKKKSAKELEKLRGERAITGFYGVNNNSHDHRPEHEFASNAPN